MGRLSILLSTRPARLIPPLHQRRLRRRLLPNHTLHKKAVESTQAPATGNGSLHSGQPSEYSPQYRSSLQSRIMVFESKFESPTRMATAQASDRYGSRFFRTL